MSPPEPGSRPLPRSKRQAEELRRLHFINALFARATGQDLYLAEQIKAGIAFSLAELEASVAQGTGDPALYDARFNAAAAALLARVFGHEARHGFYHWDATLTLASATPLFTRAEVMAGLRHLAPFGEATLLVTNLRAALIPPTRRATRRRVRDYEEALAFIRDLAAARSARGANLQLLFL